MLHTFTWFAIPLKKSMQLTLNLLLIVLLSGEQLVLARPAEQADGEMRVIVQLKGEPAGLFTARNTPGKTALRVYEEGLKAAQADLLRRLSVERIPARAGHAFMTVFNGMALTLPEADLPRLQALPQVKAVFADSFLTYDLAESVPLVGAPTVWALKDAADLPVTGQGVKVAVIDSGIDYTHPDLGGCFGAGCKVAGGWNIFNMNDDPMDDVGHGTHVAGIIAANGVLKGVAPGASLYAYKVGGAGGAPTSAVIMGIEQAALVVDVINISLGGGGNPKDALSQAVDAAVALGKVVVVAAGNNSAYETINSPGTAESAITVGASTKADAIWTLSATMGSSRGTIKSFSNLFKPELVAPGAMITSTWLGGTYQTQSGTSMAAPHVAGAAALLRQLHPAWSPAMVKATLMNTALDLGADMLTQGAGRLRVDKAAQANALIQPGGLYFGWVDRSVPTWQAEKTFTVTNLGTSPLACALNLSGALPAVATLALSTDLVNLPGGGSQSVTATLQAQTSLLPNLTAHPYTFQGAVLATCGAQTLRLPWQVFHRPVVTQVSNNPMGVATTASAAAADGSLHVIWAGGTAPGNTDIYHAASSNDGETWSAAQQLTTDPGLDLYSALARTTTGKLMAVWASNRGGGVYHLWMKTSSDNGVTWSAETQLTNSAYWDELPMLFQVPGGKLWLVWKSFREGVHGIFAMNSSDAGVTWSAEAQLVSDGYFNDAPTLTQAADGRLWLMYSSTRDGGARLVYMINTDGGFTWSGVYELGPGGTYPSLAVDGSGNLILFFNCGYSICSGESTDDGNSWAPRPAWTRAPGYEMFPRLSALGDGRIGVSWDSERNGDQAWFGIIGAREDWVAAPFLRGVNRTLTTLPGGTTLVQFTAQVEDEGLVLSVWLNLTVNGTAQPPLAMLDDGEHGDGAAGDGVYGAMGIYPTGSQVEYTLAATDNEGFTRTSGSQTFRIQARIYLPAVLK